MAGPHSGNCVLRCRVKCVDDVGGDASAGGYVVPVAACPIADCGALFAIDRRPSAARSSRTPAPAAADPPAGIHP